VVWFPTSWAYEVLYASLGLTLIALAANARRHRRGSALVAGLVGAMTLLLALHEAWDVQLFRLLVWTGAVALVAAVAFDMRGLRGCRIRRGA
jgi:hypothetical protein